MGRLLGFAAAFIPGGGFVAVGASALSGAVSFFSSPFGRWVGVALLGAGLYAVGDIHRGRIDAAKWRAAVEKTERAAAARDATIRAEMTASAAERVAAIKRESDDLQKRVTDYETAPATGGDTCRATPDVARRLRGL